MMGLEFFYQAFRDLNSCRTQGMSEGPIPWTAIEQYCQLNSIEGQQKEDLFHHVREMDDAYLTFYANKATNG